MTARQRTAVVALLRYAAESDDTISEAVGVITALANRAWGETFSMLPKPGNEGYDAACLEAALRVEEGWSP